MSNNSVKEFDLDKTEKILKNIFDEDKADFDCDKIINETEVMDNFSNLLKGYINHKADRAKNKATLRAKRIVEKNIENVKKAYENNKKKMLRVSALYFKLYPKNPVFMGYVRFLMTRKDNTMEQINSEFESNFTQDDVYDYLEKALEEI